MNLDKLDEEEQRARLRLARSDNIGPITFRHLLARYGSAGAALDALPGIARRGRGGRAARIMTADEAAREIDALHRANAHLLVLGSDRYPAPLAAIEDAPPVLIAKGNIALAHSECIGIVGARNASAIGLKMAQKLAHDLSEEGFAIASGLARGIDTSAHTGSLNGGTIAVLGGGIDVVYPRENTEIQQKIAEQGLLLSEHPLGTKPQASHFPRRNRIISGLSRGIIVIEAAMRSGSLITARLAGEQGREVFAVPGSPLDPRARGANSLIRQGATLVENAADVTEVLGNLNRIPLRESPAFDFGLPPGEDRGLDASDDQRAAIAEKLSPTPVPVDDIVRASGLDAATVMSVILELELAATAQRHPGNRVSLA